MKNRTIITAFALLSGALAAAPVFAESQSYAFTEDNWFLIAGASFAEVDGRDVVKLGNVMTEPPMFFGAAALIGVEFENGTFEYDLKFQDGIGFAGSQFRVESPGNSEDFYMRGHNSGKDDANQYMANYNGIPSWQLYYGAPYTAPTIYPQGEWFHVKMVVQDGMADIYIGDDMAPELTVALKRDQMSGGITLWGLDFGGGAMISNFSVDTESMQEVTGTPAPEPQAEPGTVMTWQVSNAVDGAALFDAGGLSDDFMSGLTFTEMNVEARGVLNLAQLQGIAEGADTALAKVTIMSETDQMKALDFGFSDDVTVYLNGMPIFSGSDRFLSRDYRFLGIVGYNDTAWLPLKAGENTLVLAVTEDVADTTGWALQGRFQDMAGMSIK